jgi:hypothetical protein
MEDSNRGWAYGKLNCFNLNYPINIIDVLIIGETNLIVKFRKKFKSKD